jgi:glycosyltransferase involved in cell wall biosynthesis
MDPMKSLKVLMVIAVFHPYIGGSEKQAQKLSQELLKGNLEVNVITGRWSNLLGKYENLQGLRVIRNQTNFRFCGQSKLDTGVDFFNPGLLIDVKKLKFIRVLFRKIFIRASIYIYQISLFIFLLGFRRNYDIIHTHQVLYPAFISTLCAKILKKPVIVKVGSSGFNSDINQIKKFPEGRFQLKFILRNISKLVCTSSKMKEEFLVEGIDGDKIILIPNGVNVSNLSRSFKDCSSLLYLGRFTKTKNIETIIFAFSKIIMDINSNLRLTLIGDGPESDYIIDLIKKHNLEKNILLTGFVDNPGDYLKKSDLFIFPSLIEGLSNSLIEAMSHKLPCIVSNIPGNVEVLGENNLSYNIEKGKFIKTKYGILFNPSDIEGLFNSVKFMLENPDIRKELGESAFEKVVREYDIKIIADRYKELYKEVLK